MPVSFEYYASQSHTHVYVDVALPYQVAVKELDVTLTDAYLSVSAATHNLVLDFSDSVMYEQAICKVKGRTLKLEVPKERAGEWAYLFLVSEGISNDLVERRNYAFERLKLRNLEKENARKEAQAKIEREAADRQLELRQAERAKMRAAKENEEQRLRDEIQYMTPEEAMPYQNIPAPRSQYTTTIVANFTKRKYAVPARDNRDMYFDDFQGQMIPDIKAQPVDVMLVQAANYIKRPTPEYESALDICAQVIKRAPTYLKGIAMMSQIYMQQGRFDDSLMLTSQMMKIITNKTDNPQLYRAQYSREMQSKINAMHGASLCGAGKYRDGLRYLESAYALNKANERLERDLEMVRRTVKFVDSAV